MRDVLQEYARFPASKEELIEAQGWKVIDLEGDRRVHAKALQEKLDKEMYWSVGEVIEGLERVEELEVVKEFTSN